MQHRNRDPRISRALGLDMSFTREIAPNDEKTRKTCFLLFFDASGRSFHLRRTLQHCRGRGGGEFFFQKSDGLYYKEIGCRNSPEMCVSFQKRNSFSSKKVMGSIKTEIDCRNAHFVQISRGFLSKKVRGVRVPPHAGTGRTTSKSTF